jgi:hypothetical protein
MQEVVGVVQQCSSSLEVLVAVVLVVLDMLEQQDTGKY